MDVLIKKIGTATIDKYTPGRILSVELTRTLWDLDQRFQIMDNYNGLLQVVTPSGPPLELIAPPQQAAELAKLYNDEMADLVARYPDRFLAAVACIPMNNIDAALKETKRAIDQLAFKGILINTPLHINSLANSNPVDLPEFMQIYELMSAYDLPVWIHPAGEVLTPDYATEDRSKYMIYQSFGWPHDTTVAMARLVFSGVL